MHSAQFLLDHMPRDFTYSELGLENKAPHNEVLNALANHKVLLNARGHPGTMKQLAPCLYDRGLSNCEDLAEMLLLGFCPNVSPGNCLSSLSHPPSSITNSNMPSALSTLGDLQGDRSDTRSWVGSGAAEFRVVEPPLSMSSAGKRVWEVACREGIQDKGCLLAWVGAVIHGGGGKEDDQCDRALWDNLSKQLQHHLCRTLTIPSTAAVVEVEGSYGLQGCGGELGNLVNHQEYGYGQILGQPRGMNEDDLIFVQNMLERNGNGLESLGAYVEFSKWWGPLVSTLLLLQHEWSSHAIFGFVGRYKAERLLLDQDSGTFLLRFSETKPGVLVLSFTDKAQKTPTVQARTCVSNFVQHSLIHVEPKVCYMVVEGTTETYRNLGQLLDDCIKLWKVYPSMESKKDFIGRVWPD
ncbi:unnamed protein product [Choristocarpus tenellus]